MEKSIKHQKFLFNKMVEILDRMIELKRLDVESKKTATITPKYQSGGIIGNEKEFPEAGEHVVPKSEWIKRRNEHIFKTFCANHKKAEKSKSEFEKLADILNPQKNSEILKNINKEI